LCATIAPGGVGESTNAIVEVLAMVTGLPLPHRPALRIASGKQFRVRYVNGEDPIEETERRFQATMLHFGIKPEDILGRLFTDSGRDQDFVFARENGKVVTIAEPVVDSVMAGIKEKGIDCLILDPVVSFHKVAENDNTKLRQPGTVLSRRKRNQGVC
jgi:RecA-family ATPase